MTDIVSPYEEKGMTTFGAHAFVWAAEWTEEGAETALRGAAARGLEFVEIPLLSDLDAFPLELTRELVEETGLEVTASLGLPADCHMPSTPRARWRSCAGRSS